MIQLTSSVFIILVAILHFYFLVLEMFLWTKPFGLKTFKQSLEKAQASKVLAANQGLYNGFLATGLVWGLATQDSHASFAIKVFFLSCVVIAGIFGAATVNKRIFFVQALPALIALVLL